MWTLAPFHSSGDKDSDRLKAYLTSQPIPRWVNVVMVTGTRIIYSTAERLVLVLSVPRESCSLAHTMNRFLLLSSRSLSKRGTGHAKFLLLHIWECRIYNFLGLKECTNFRVLNCLACADQSYFWMEFNENSLYLITKEIVTMATRISIYR